MLSLTEQLVISMRALPILVDGMRTELDRAWRYGCIYRALLRSQLEMMHERTSQIQVVSGHGIGIRITQSALDDVYRHPG